MRRRSLLLLGALLLAFVALIPGTALAGSVLYVNASVSGGAADGSSWTDAYADLQSALSTAASGDEVWVAAGTYTPTAGTDRSATFALKSGVALYGGFAGTETLRSQRDWVANHTILSGDIGSPNNSGDNSYHVVTADGVTLAVLDGFTVTLGNAGDGNGGGMHTATGSVTVANVVFSSNAAAHGGGMYNDSGSPTLTNVAFNSNYAMNFGGGMCSMLGSAVLTNVSFDWNDAGSGGGGMYNGASSPTLTDVTFTSNYGWRGGGIRGYMSSPTLTRVTFRTNSAGAEGGGLYAEGGSPVFTNAVLSGNNAPDGGGVSVEGGSPVFTNVSFSQNIADRGGAIYSLGSSPTLTNCILWGDTGYAAGAELYGGATITYSDVKGGNEGTGNVDADPLFLDVPTADLHLKYGSPAIDAGNGAVAPATDLDGIFRPQDGNGDDTPVVDMGAYEYELVEPLLTSIDPVEGIETGGTSVTLTGGGFKPKESTVKFGEAAAENVTVVSPNQITCTSPGGSGAVDVTVTTPGGTTGPVTFTYMSVPAVTSVSPTQVSTAGGSITINGTGFTSVSAVTVGGASAAFTPVSPTQLTATAPAHAVGKVDVQVTTPYGSSPVTGTANDLYYLTRYEQTDAHLFFSGTWSPVTSGSASGGSYVSTTTSGSCLTVCFTGPRIDLLATVGPAQGIASVYLDGVATTPLDLYRPGSSLARQRVLAKTNLSAGVHTLVSPTPTRRTRVPPVPR